MENHEDKICSKQCSQIKCPDCENTNIDSDAPEETIVLAGTWEWAR